MRAVDFGNAQLLQVWPDWHKFGASISAVTPSPYRGLMQIRITQRLRGRPVTVEFKRKRKLPPAAASSPDAASANAATKSLILS